MCECVYFYNSYRFYHSITNNIEARTTVEKGKKQGVVDIIPDETLATAKSDVISSPRRRRRRKSRAARKTGNRKSSIGHEIDISAVCRSSWPNMHTHAEIRGLRSPRLAQIFDFDRLLKFLASDFREYIFMSNVTFPRISSTKGTGGGGASISPTRGRPTSRVILRNCVCSLARKTISISVVTTSIRSSNEREFKVGNELPRVKKFSSNGILVETIEIPTRCIPCIFSQRIRLVENHFHLETDRDTEPNLFNLTNDRDRRNCIPQLTFRNRERN